MSHVLLAGLVTALFAFHPALAPLARAQSAVPAQSRLRVYIETCDCFPDFLRTEIQWVDFVRQQQDADVQILGTSRATGAGGVETVLRFVGSGRFAGIDHELRSATPPGESEDVRRRNVLRTVIVGLLGFSAREGLPGDLRLEVETASQGPQAVQRDPWNFWVFQVGADAALDAEESNREEQWGFNASADRVTDNWIVSFGGEFESETETFDLDEEDEDPFKVVSDERRFDWFIAKSLGQHWSLGLDGDVESATFNNVKLRTEVLPAVEFNLFPYEQYASRQLRMEYAVGFQSSKYNEVTLFGLTEETRPLHEVSATLDQREPWGTLQASVQWSQYLHDLSKNRLEFDGEMDLRIVRGLSLNVQGQASRIRDQLALPARGATPEEVLLRVRELQSGYSLSFSMGISYSFGSIFNNIVNPRFGRNNQDNN